MDNAVDSANVEDFLPAVVVLLKNVADSLVESEDGIASDDSSPSDRVCVSRVTKVHDALVDMNTIITSVLHDFRLAHMRYILDKELGFWVLPRSTAWFSQFLLHEYSDDRWVQNFRFTKSAVFRLAAVLAPYCERQDTWYRKAVLVRVRVALALYKLVQGASLLIYSEQFAIGISTLYGTLRDVVQAMNSHFRGENSVSERESAAHYHA
jgi:hypothetical protein